jgi:hypothetical protein
MSEEQAFNRQPFPSSTGRLFQNGPEARRCWARRKRTLDGEDRSGIINKMEGSCADGEFSDPLPDVESEFSEQFAFAIRGRSVNAEEVCPGFANLRNINLDLVLFNGGGRLPKLRAVIIDQLDRDVVFIQVLGIKMHA